MTAPSPETPEYWAQWFSQIPTVSALRYVWEIFAPGIKGKSWFAEVEQAKDQRKAELQRLERK